jgi:hypothetical protein
VVKTFHIAVEAAISTSPQNGLPASKRHFVAFSQFFLVGEPVRLTPFVVGDRSLTTGTGGAIMPGCWNLVRLQGTFRLLHTSKASSAHAFKRVLRI